MSSSLTVSSYICCDFFSALHHPLLHSAPPPCEEGQHDKEARLREERARREFLIFPKYSYLCTTPSWSALEVKIREWKLNKAIATYNGRKERFICNKASQGC